MDTTAWVAPGAFVRGDVTIDEQANIWYNAVLRGDQESITVGKATSVQDNCVLHGDAGCNVVVGQYVTVGHGAVLHGCTVEDGALIGMHATVLSGAHIGAGSVVTRDIPPMSFAAGVPCKVIRPITEADSMKYRPDILADNTGKNVEEVTAACERSMVLL